MVLKMAWLQGKWSQILQSAKLQYILNLTLLIQLFMMEASQGVRKYNMRGPVWMCKGVKSKFMGVTVRALTRCICITDAFARPYVISVHLQ